MEKGDSFVFVGPAGQKAEREGAQMGAQAKIVLFDHLEVTTKARESCLNFHCTFKLKDG